MVKVEIIKELHRRGFQPKDVALRLGYAHPRGVLRLLRRAGIRLPWGYEDQ